MPRATWTIEQNERAGARTCSPAASRGCSTAATRFSITSPRGVRDAARLAVRSCPTTSGPFPASGPPSATPSTRRGCVSTARFPTRCCCRAATRATPPGLERGIREIADAAGVPLVVYLKEEDNFGRESDSRTGRGGPARRVGTSLRHQVRRRAADPSQDDPYLDALLARVDRRRVISGMGERPAVVHLRHRRLPGFTTGSGCVAPSLSQSIFDAASKGDWAAAEDVRAPASCRSRTCATRWGPRACCTPPSTRPASPRPGRFLRSSASWTDGQRAEVARRRRRRSPGRSRSPSAELAREPAPARRPSSSAVTAGSASTTCGRSVIDRARSRWAFRPRTTPASPSSRSSTRGARPTRATCICASAPRK